MTNTTVQAFSTGTPARQVETTLAYDIGHGPAAITATGPWGEVTGEGHDGFAALENLRTALEPHGWRLAVAGARRDVCCIGAARSMSQGTRAYLLREGQPLTDALSIFDPAEPSTIGTVEEQQQALQQAMSQQ